MDIESATRPPIVQATEDDMQGVLAGDFGATLRLLRNYGDRLEAEATAEGTFRLAYYDATNGRWQQAEAPLGRDQVKEAFWDYFQGKWNWHGSQTWRTINESAGH